MTICMHQNVYASKWAFIERLQVPVSLKHVYDSVSVDENACTYT